MESKEATDEFRLKGVPKAFIDRVSEKLMQDPHVLQCGHTFDKAVIADQFARGRAACPLGCQLASADFSKECRPNYQFREAMEEVLRRNPKYRSWKCAATLYAEQAWEHSQTPTGDSEDEEKSAAGFSLEEFLAGIGLSEHYAVLAKERIDTPSILGLLGHSELKELGFPMGHRLLLMNKVAKLPVEGSVSAVAGKRTAETEQ
jgi:hypothetical protein